MRSVHHSEQAPRAIGPYSHSASHGGVLYCSGQLPLHPTSGEFVGSDAPAQARQCLENLAAVCAGAGTSLTQALRLTVYVVDLAAFAEVNRVYAEFFAAEPPARTLVQVAALPRCALVEIDAIVAL